MQGLFTIQDYFIKKKKNKHMAGLEFKTIIMQ